jgi:hypothetical protein
VRIRTPDVSDQDIYSTGAAASTPHLHAIPKRPQSCGASINLNEFIDKSTGQAQNTPASLEKTLADDQHFPQASPESNALFNTGLAILKSPVDEDFPVQGGACISEFIPTSPRDLGSSNLQTPRSELIVKKIRELDTKITTLQSHLESDERRAKNIAILTPFRKTTRSKLLSVIQNLAKPIMRMRLEMEKLKCYRTILLGDLVSERVQTKRTALRVAADSPRLRRPNTAPTLTSPTRGDFEKQNSTPASLSNSTSTSFHSARDSASDWHSEFAGDSPLHSSPKPDSREPEALIPSSTIPLFEPEREDQDSVSEKVQQGDEDDQAEEWNKTRVAQRVSLIYVPSDFAIATRLKAVFESNNDQT